MSEKVVTKLVYGLGFNSGEYPSRNGRKMTKEYDLWTNMLHRCTEKCWVKRPSYQAQLALRTLNLTPSFISGVGDK